MKTSNFSNVGDLKKFLNDHGDDTPILNQVVGGKNGGAWNLWGKISSTDAGDKIILQLEHDDLKKLPDLEKSQSNSAGLNESDLINDERKRIAEIFMTSLLKNRDSYKDGDVQLIKDAYQLADDFMNYKL